MGTQGDGDEGTRGHGDTGRWGDGDILAALSPCHPVPVSPRLLVIPSPCPPVSLSSRPLVPVSPRLLVSVSPRPLIPLSSCPLVPVSPIYAPTSGAITGGLPSSGSVKVKLAPPSGWFVAQMRPPWASTMPLQMARPRPTLPRALSAPPR